MISKEEITELGYYWESARRILLAGLQRMPTDEEIKGSAEQLRKEDRRRSLGSNTDSDSVTDDYSTTATSVSSGENSEDEKKAELNPEEAAEQICHLHQEIIENLDSLEWFSAAGKEKVQDLAKKIAAVKEGLNILEKRAVQDESKENDFRVFNVFRECFAKVIYTLNYHGFTAFRTSLDEKELAEQINFVDADQQNIYHLFFAGWKNHIETNFNIESANLQSLLTAIQQVSDKQEKFFEQELFGETAFDIFTQIKGYVGFEEKLGSFCQEIENKIFVN